MKAYIKPAIAEAELFTQDSIALTIPKTTYKKNAAGFTRDQLLAYALNEGQSVSGNGSSSLN